MKIFPAVALVVFLYFIGGIIESDSAFAGDKGRTRSSFGKRIPIDFGNFPEVIHFSGDRIYIGKRQCQYESDDVAVEVYDRETFRHLRTVEIAKCDDLFQDVITSLVSDDNNLYASIQSRYAQEGRVNFVVIDKKSLQISKKAHVTEGVGTLAFKDKALIACADVYGEGNDCSLLDPISLKKHLRQACGV